jgi:hypothetical protein
MKTIVIRSKAIRIPHLCPGDNDKRRDGPLGPPYREFQMEEGLHTICCDGCGRIYQFKIVKEVVH